MQLPNVFKHSEPMEQIKLFISVLLSDQSVHSALWTVADNQIVVSHRSQVHYYQKDEERILKIDQSLQDLGPDSEKTDNVVFAFEPSWVNDKGILDSKKQQLKEISDELSLKPVGFVVVTEALQESLARENPMLSTVILYISQRFVELSLLKQGQLVAKQMVGRSQNIVADLKEAVARLQQTEAGAGKLPPNVILSSALIDSFKLNEFQQQLVDQNWAQDLNFLQTPVIKLLGQEKILDIVVAEGGRAVAEAHGLLKSDAVRQQPVSSSPAAAQTQASSFGVPIKPEVAAQQQPSSQPHTQQPEKLETAVSPHAQAQAAQTGQAKVVDSALPDVNIPEKPVADLNDLDGKPVSLDTKSKKSKLPIILGVLGGLLAVAVIAFIFLQQAYKVSINLIAKKKAVSKEAEVVLTEGDTTEAATDSAELAVKATATYKEASGEKDKATTGIKLVGEEATGEVTILNKTEEEKTFEEGTLFTAKDQELEYRLVEEVTVDAAVVEEQFGKETKEYGQAKAEIKATEIGADYNLADETEFQIESYADDTYEAKAEGELEGGASREIRVVSEEDQTALENELIRELLKKAQQELEDENGNGKYAAATDDYEILEKEFSDEVSNEVENLSLSMKLKVKGLSYTSEDLKPLAERVLQDQVPEGYFLQDEEPSIMSQPAEENDEGDFVIKMNISSEAVAEVKPDEIQQQLLGKPLSEAKAILNENKSLEKAEIMVQPWMASMLFDQIPDQNDKLQVNLQE